MHMFEIYFYCTFSIKIVLSLLLTSLVIMKSSLGPDTSVSCDLVCDLSWSLLALVLVSLLTLLIRDLTTLGNLNHNHWDNTDMLNVYLNIFAVLLWYLLTLFTTRIAHAAVLLILHLALLFTLRYTNLFSCSVTLGLLQSLTLLIIHNLHCILLILLTFLNIIILNILQVTIFINCRTSTLFLIFVL